MKNTTYKDYLIIGIAILVHLGFFSLLYLMITKAVPKDNEQIINIMIGVLGTIVVMVDSYFFGSSAGSDKKTEMLFNSTPLQQVMDKIEPTPTEEVKPETQQ